MARGRTAIVSDPTWYKDAIIYELHVKSFFDASGDGIGDFRGLTQKLDYLQSLGVTAIWLLPFYPSPLRDDGYDIADYTDVHPNYGTLRDFKVFLQEAHRRGLRVITELVLNHTSDQHAWFRRARQAKTGSTWRDYYVWHHSPEKYQDARIIFKDFESSNWAWDPAARAYYWHRFYSHQPDLNFDNPAVIRALIQVMDFWFEMGVDGMRLDAVPYLYEREGTNCENLPETYAFLEKLRAHVDRKFGDRLLLAEANQWPEDAVAYYGTGNRCQMAFHFPVMPRLFMGSWMEDRFPIIDIFEQTPDIPETCQWAMFLRNHDELTLEMVSDEERDFMYRVYARDPSARINLGIRRRLAPLLNNNRRRIELMNFLLLSLPGTPVLYYGDEIGMGDNHFLGDRNGVRTPMQWNADRNAGFSRTNPQQLFLPVIIDPDYHFESVNVEAQDRNQSSLLWWNRRVIAMRKRFKAFGRGSIKFLEPENPKILAFTREHQDERILVVANLSRFSQAVELDLSAFTGFVPEEVASGNRFPSITEKPYLLTLGFHNYYWFSLIREKPLEIPADGARKREVDVGGSWTTVFQGKAREQMERGILPAYLKSCRWFGGKGRAIQHLSISHVIPVERDGVGSYILVLSIRYSEGSNETYQLPVSAAWGEEATALEQNPHAIIAAIRSREGRGVLFDAVYREGFRTQLLRTMARRQSTRLEGGEVASLPGRSLQRRRKDLPLAHSQVLRAEQSNTSILYGTELFLKLFRRLDEGLNPDVELSSVLTEKGKFPHVSPVAGTIELRLRGSDPVALVMLQEFVRNQGDAWSIMLDEARTYLERVLTAIPDHPGMPDRPLSLLEAAEAEPDSLLQELIGGVAFERALLLGQRTGEMHLALSRIQDNERFAPEPFSLLYQRSLYHGMRTQIRRTLGHLRKQARTLPPDLRAKAHRVADLERDILRQLSGLFGKKIPAVKIRIHGDYHLGQVLFTGNDFLIIDFEGEPSKTIGERRLKRSPLRDVAGMIRSFHYPTYATLFNSKAFPEDAVRNLVPWAELWYMWMAGAFLKAYLRTTSGAPFMPRARDEMGLLLSAFLLEKAAYEIGYELNNRPDWVIIPMQGILQLMEVADDNAEG